jgi:uncharacterized protein (DUF302 family)
VERWRKDIKNDLLLTFARLFGDDNRSGIALGLKSDSEREVRPMAETTSGLVTLKSAHSVEETVARIRAVLQAKGIQEFALIDHSGEAQKAGLTMPKTQVVIFGNPKGGTPLMLAAPSVAIDLPLKLLVREDAGGQVWISYWSAQALLKRHGLAESFAANIAAIEAIARQAAE